MGIIWKYGVGCYALVIMLVSGMTVVNASDGQAAVLLSADGIPAADFWDSRTLDGAPGPEGRASSFVQTSVTGRGGWHYEFDPNAIAVPDQRGGLITTPGSGVRAMTFTFALSGSSVGSQDQAATQAMFSSEPLETRPETERYFARRFDRAGELAEAAKAASQSGPSTISEPASLLLLGTGLIGLSRRRWSRARGRAAATA